ncbi:hypothetical protein JKP88DRAFT_276753 [Tribonema minus]|uniref:Uncharacterized protein n=1 Tax=Tribonema minus TaxID=303371 RepID=A0A835Z341_9STRA|nr:hypothetical protein JKP88DRAFT_276753 [Tribonema minus]
MGRIKLSPRTAARLAKTGGAPDAAGGGNSRHAEEFYIPDTLKPYRLAPTIDIDASNHSMAMQRDSGDSSPAMRQSMHGSAGGSPTNSMMYMQQPQRNNGTVSSSQHMQQQQQQQQQQQLVYQPAMQQQQLQHAAMMEQQQAMMMQEQQAAAAAALQQQQQQHQEALRLQQQQHEAMMQQQQQQLQQEAMMLQQQQEAMMMQQQQASMMHAAQMQQQQQAMMMSPDHAAMMQQQAHSPFPFAGHKGPPSPYPQQPPAPVRVPLSARGCFAHIGTRGVPTDDRFARGWAAFLVIVPVLTFLFGAWAHYVSIAAEVLVLLPSCALSCCTRARGTWWVWGAACLCAAPLYAVAAVIALIQGDDHWMQSVIVLVCGALLSAVGKLTADAVVRACDGKSGGGGGGAAGVQGVQVDLGGMPGSGGGGGMGLPGGSMHPSMHPSMHGSMHGMPMTAMSTPMYAQPGAMQYGYGV